MQQQRIEGGTEKQFAFVYGEGTKWKINENAGIFRYIVETFDSVDFRRHVIRFGSQFSQFFFSAVKLEEKHFETQLTKLKEKFLANKSLTLKLLITCEATN